MNAPRLLTAPQVAEEIGGVSVDYVYAHILGGAPGNGVIVYRLPGRKTRYDRDSILRWIKAHRLQVTPRRK